VRFHHAEDNALEFAGGTWAPKENLDAFCTKVYEYYVSNGFWCIVISRVANLINLAFTIILSTFLLLFVDWPVVIDCTKDCSHIIRSNVLEGPSIGEVLVLVYFVIFSLYWLWSVIGFVFALYDGLEMQQFYSTHLDIKDEEIPMLQWFEVLDRLVKLQERVKICIVKQLDALDITNRIMRKDNYMISLINSDVFGFESWWGRGHYTGIYGNTLDWNLRFCILDSLFNEKFSIRNFLDPSEQYSDNVNLRNGIYKLQKRFVTMGIISFIFMPFIAIFMVIYFVLKHFEELHSKRSTLGPREWSTYAKWHLRMYNELPHFFEKRLRKSFKPSISYFEQFPARATTIVAQSIAYIAGAIVGILLFLSLTGSKSILNVYVGNRALIWYLAVFTAVLAISRSFIPEALDTYNPHKAMAEVVNHIHYCPNRWKGKFHLKSVHEEFGSMFKPTYLVFLGEVLNVITTPFILCCYMPRRAEAILRCLKQVTVEVKGIGEVCGPAAFDLESFSGEPSAFKKISATPKNLKRSNFVDKEKGEAKIGSTEPRFRRKYAHGDVNDDKSLTSNSASVHQQALRAAFLRPFQSNHGKLDKSFVAFLCNHPFFKTKGAGARFLTALMSNIEHKNKSMESKTPLQTPDKKSRFLKASKTVSERDHHLLASQLPLSIYMAGDNASSQKRFLHTPRHDENVGTSQKMSESHSMLLCSFSQLLQRKNQGPASEIVIDAAVAGNSVTNYNEKTQLFAALEEVYEQDPDYGEDVVIKT